MIRLPEGLRKSLVKRARSSGRSMNAEVVDAVRKHLEGPDLLRKTILEILAEERAA